MQRSTNAHRLLLLSSSTTYGSGYLDYAETEIRDFLGSVSSVLFVPFALQDRDGYAGQVRERFARMGYVVDSLHDAADATQSVRGAEAMFIGGGNTFRLLKSLQEMRLLPVIRERVENGMRYLGSSAGSV
ncbi:MAG: Type 1 glutamine amidotransferase-like domain-containing protein, partial [Chthoniobacterales bacterium]|nr:Type 1 glutamine amidotransferase-like domain-containing protein [Chthoniobacterales bacterium]